MHPLDIHAGGTERVAPPDFRWPGARRIAVFFRVSFEWWSDGKVHDIGPMGNPLKSGVLLVEHDVYSAFHVADRGYALEMGAIVRSGRASGLAQDPEVQRAYLGV